MPGRLHRHPLVGCTIAAHNYLPLVRVLARSFLDHHPSARFVVALIDHPLASRALTGECFDVIPVTDLDFGEAEFQHMATSYELIEFATSVKPFLLRRLLGEAECVLYLDPDICVYASLRPLIESTISAGWSLTPHCASPMTRNETHPAEADIMAAGVYNLGYIGVTAAADPFLDWWAERLRHHSVIDQGNQLFTDQRWIDLAIPVFPPHIERSPAYNVAYWNLDQRQLRRDGDTVTVDGEPLRFFHFSGYDRDVPWWLTKYQPTRPRALLSEHPIVGDLCYAHTEAVSAAKGDEEPLTYGWAEAFPGMPLDKGVRRMFREELMLSEAAVGAAPPSPFAPGGAARFRRWLSMPGPASRYGLPRYLEVLWRQHGWAAFPEVADGQTERFREWLAQSDQREVVAMTLLEMDANSSARPETAIPMLGRERHGIDVVGYLAAELGTGEAGRLAIAALTAACIPVASITCRQTASRDRHPFVTDEVSRHDTVLIAINADQLGHVRHQLGSDFFDDRYVIGQWFWEVEAFPESLVGAFPMVHEVWVATDHVRRALQACSPDQAILLMPLPLVAPPVQTGIGKADFGLEDRFTFLFMFDFWSAFERKNPLAVVQAFSEAFRDGEGPVLVIKTINGRDRQHELERLHWAARGRTDIVIRDGYLDTGMNGALTASCDCYVSLHRAEGLGLTMSEAMALGKPVIATAYSGNMDFMTPESAYLVPWERTQIGPNAPPYPADATWAEPDISAAAHLMRAVVEDPAGAANVGQVARIDLATRFSPLSTGTRMRERLQAVWASRYA